MVYLIPFWYLLGIHHQPQFFFKKSTFFHRNLPRGRYNNSLVLLYAGDLQIRSLAITRLFIGSLGTNLLLLRRRQIEIMWSIVKNKNQHWTNFLILVIVSRGYRLCCSGQCHTNKYQSVKENASSINVFWSMLLELSYWNLVLIPSVPLHATEAIFTRTFNKMGHCMYSV